MTDAPMDEAKLRALVEVIEAAPIKVTEFIEVASQSGVSVSLALRAFNGFISAALELHETYLPNHHWNASDRGVSVYPKPDYNFPIGEDLEHSFDVVTTPARAWLLAVLSALIQENHIPIPHAAELSALIEGEG